MQASTYSPLSPRVFFLSSFLKFHSPLPSPTPQRGATAHLFLFESAFKYLLNVPYRTFFQIPYLTFFLSSSRSSICLIKISTRMLEKNTRTTLLLHQHPSCLVLFDSGASSFSQPQACYLFFFLAFSFLLAFLLSSHLKQARLGSFLSARSYIS